MKQSLKLVSINHERCEVDKNKLKAVEHIHTHFRIAYPSFHMLGPKDSIGIWLKCLEDHSADTILSVLSAVLKGKKPEFNARHPTPMQFSKLCYELDMSPFDPSLTMREAIRIFEQG